MLIVVDIHETTLTVVTIAFAAVVCVLHVLIGIVFVVEDSPATLALPVSQGIAMLASCGVVDERALARITTIAVHHDALDFMIVIISRTCQRKMN